MSITLNGDTGITTPMYNGSITANAVTPVIGMKNKIINGACVIDQRNAGALVNPAVDSAYYLDRWLFRGNVASKFSVGQNAGSVTPPTGFTKYLGYTSLSAYSVGANDFFFTAQAIEGNNVADLGFGTASAKTITISFQVYSSLTGTFGGTLRNGANNRYCPFSYTVSSANTWTTISVTIAGDTTGTWATDNSAGLYVYFNLGTGSTYSGGTSGVWGSTAYFTPTGTVSVVGTNGATFYITGVQLEVGSTATSFDYRPYGTELALCQRYCPVITGQAGNPNLVMGYAYSTTVGIFAFTLPVSPRVSPTGITVSGTMSLYYGGASTKTSITPTINNGVDTYITINCGTSGLTAGQALLGYVESSTMKFIFTGCEL